MTGAPEVFDRRQVRRQRDRAAPRLATHDFLLREVAERLTERLEDVTRRFPRALDLGDRDGVLSRALDRPHGRRGGIEWLVRGELSEVLLRQGPGTGAAAGPAAGPGTGPALVADAEALPFAAGSFDLVLSLLDLHWVNDLPGALAQIRHVLRPDGLFLGALLGGETLSELRAVLLAAEAEVSGGASPRVAPKVDLRDAGALLQRAGFALPVADADTLTVSYPNALALMRELRGMGEGNAVAGRSRRFTRRAVLLRAAALYEERFADADGRVPATFQVLYLTGWAPHDSQPRPLHPGSAQASLARALDADRSEP